MNRRRIKSDAQVKRLFDALIEDIVSAGVFFRLLSRLGDSKAQFEDVFRAAPAFWTYSSDAIRESCLIRLSRVYDQRPDTVCLRTVLECVKGNQSLFTSDALMMKVSGLILEGLRPGESRINADQLNADLACVSLPDPIVKRLVAWRGAHGAHTSTAVALGENRSVLPKLSENDIRELVTRSLKIYNRYLHAFEATHVAGYVIDERDFEFLLRMAQLGLKTHLSEIDPQRSPQNPPLP